MLYAALAVVIGRLFLVWSADRFIDGAAATARHFGMPPLLIGMVIVGFGTSAPEMVVSVLSALDGSPGIALGNAYGSNITNIALILGVTALVSPIMVQKNIVRQELPILLAVMGISIYLVWDGYLSLADGVLMLALLVCYMVGTVLYNLKKAKTQAAADEEDEVAAMGLPKALLWLTLGLIVLVLSSRLLVWGAVEIAKELGVSDLIIGLTVVAVGTSLPELASSVIAARKNEHDIAIGNVVGSNLFNALGVVGLATVLHPMEVPAEILGRDAAVMTALTVLLLLFSLGKGSIGRIKGGVLLAAYVAYTVYLIAVSF